MLHVTKLRSFWPLPRPRIRQAPCLGRSLQNVRIVIQSSSNRHPMLIQLHSAAHLCFVLFHAVSETISVLPGMLIISLNNTPCRRNMPEPSGAIWSGRASHSRGMSLKRKESTLHSFAMAASYLFPWCAPRMFTNRWKRSNQ